MPTAPLPPLPAIGRPALGVYAFDQVRLIEVPLGLTEAGEKRVLVVEQQLDGPKRCVPGVVDGTYRRLWPLASVFARYLAAHPHLFAGKTVLELGAGAGAVGLACAALGAAFVALTDVPEALSLVEVNRTRNAPLLGKPDGDAAGCEGRGDGLGRTCVLPCRWGDESHIAALLAANGGRGYDVVVACDVIYKQVKEVLIALAATQQRLMLSPGGVCMLAYEFRGEFFDDVAYFDAANERFEVTPLSLGEYEGDLKDPSDEESRWLYTYTHK